MRNDRGFQAVRGASLAVTIGGLLMAVLWIVFTTVHGPTSFNREGVVLGRSMLFWGGMLGGPPNLLIALGLIILYPRFVSRASLRARVGYALTVLGLVVPACIDLFVWGGLGPPFFVPVVGIGAILLATGSWHNPRLQRQNLNLLMFIGVCQLLAFALALVPLGVADQFGGYRIFGLFAHFVTGIGWIVLGISLWKTRVPIVIKPA